MYLHRSAPRSALTGPYLLRVAVLCISCNIFGRPYAKRFGLCYWAVVCPVCLSVMLVYCGQTVGWIKMPLGMEVGLDSRDIVLDGDPATPKIGAQQVPTFRLMSIVAKRSPTSATSEQLLLHNTKRC